MKLIIQSLLLLSLSLWIGCTNSRNALGAGTESINSPPFPKTKSILPIEVGNTWTFSYTKYDSLGKKIIPNNIDLHLSISGCYGLQNDSLIPLCWNCSYNKSYSAYAYQFEWEDQNKGYLVVYRDLYPLDKRGLYIVGEFDGASARLYPSEQLWLAYPADSGKKWQYNLEEPADSSKTSFMELISTNGRFYCPDSNSMTSLLFYDCYVYKETNGASVYYYYFNEHVGELGYLQFINGKLRVTYLLKSLTHENQYDQYQYSYE
jgi:hypothetical protein